jgi:uncharacterized protein
MSDGWHPFRTASVDGLQGKRLDLWRNHRLWFMAESGYLIDGFENRPGTHAWQGEHLGKWLHAATLAYQITKDERLKAELDRTVQRLLATQLPNGYLGTYAEEQTFMAMPENRCGWDTWTHRYNLYGLLIYEARFQNDRVVDACRRMGNLLIEVYGEGRYDLTKYGTRQGISATALLESIVMLYERTAERKYLVFAEHIVAMMEDNPDLRLMGTMLEGGSVVQPGEGKGYQLMANLLGYLGLYRCTDKKVYLDTAINGWWEIKKKHLLVTGGPWTRHTDYNGNRECFAEAEAFDPCEISVEGCCDTTWVQLCLNLFELTGQTKYIDDAEVTLYNSLYGHQHADGMKWCYYTAPNEAEPEYVERIHCCASSMPRALEMVANHLIGQIDGHLSINTVSPCTAELTERFGGGRLVIRSEFPREAVTEVCFETTTCASYVCEFRLPARVALKGVRVNGETTQVTKNSRGYHELNRLWQSGDVLAIETEFELAVHVQRGENGRKWLAFSHGPIALAQKISAIPDDEPFAGVSSDEALGTLKASADGSCRVDGRDITLMPYHLACTEDSGPRTYFRSM